MPVPIWYHAEDLGSAPNMHQAKYLLVIQMINGIKSVDHDKSLSKMQLLWPFLLFANGEVGGRCTKLKVAATLSQPDKLRTKEVK